MLAFVCPLSGAMLASGGVARADDPPPGTRASANYASLLDRPHTIAELVLGAIVLPTAPISPANRSTNSIPLVPLNKLFTTGDATIETGMHILYRTGNEFAFGAGILFAPNPSSESIPETVNNVARTHSRSYFSMGLEGRYFPFRYRRFEGWIGLAAGAVVIADRFQAANIPSVPSILGPPEVDLRTEGFYYGVQAGADYLLTENLVLGFVARANRWLLPSPPADSHDPSCDAFGDCPTISGTVEAFEFGFTIGYRIPL